MWWNILPSWFITGGLIYAPALIASGAAFVYTGSIYTRERATNYYHYLIFRDQKILDGKDPYRQLKHLGGLDKIPDE